MVRVANVEGLLARKTGKDSRTWYFRLAVPRRDQKRAGVQGHLAVSSNVGQSDRYRATPQCDRTRKVKAGEKAECRAAEDRNP